MSPTPTKVSAQTVTITPAQAQALLDANTANRKIRHHIVSRYARDMNDGNWKLNGEAVKIAEDGELLDGQHRLLACVEADVPFETILIVGLEFEARETMDSGVKRSFTDVLRWHGETNTAGLAAAIEAAMVWDESGTPMHMGMVHSNHERMKYLQENPDIRDAVKDWRFGKAPFKFAISNGAPFLMRARRLSSVDADAFIAALHSGENLDNTSSIYWLRSWLLNMAARRGRPPREEYAAMAVKAWNAWVSGRPVRRLAWRRGGANPEEFPMMIGPDGRSYEERLTEPGFTSAASFQDDGVRNLADILTTGGSSSVAV